MATTVLQNHQEGVPPNLRKHLAVAVRSIQWSYAIFWSISSRQPGVLEWGDGYYNGDIKTRRTVQAVELNADQLGLRRSEQLRELYESLASAAGETNPLTRRPTAALSPEDLTETEWYYLVCMSFVFNVGQGLPGRALANAQPIWLCNAHFADSKLFSRSLLAKSASIQTVVCFPFLGGVLELGVTEPVLEDPNLIQNIQTTFLENLIPHPGISKKLSPKSGTLQNDDNPTCTELDCKILDSILSPVTECEEVKISSPDQNSDSIGPNQLSDESFMVEGINEGASQVQSLHFMDDDFSNCNHNSMDSSDCISQIFANPGKTIPIPNHERVNNHCILKLQDCDLMKLKPLDVRSDELRYQSILGALLKGSHQLISGPHLRNRKKESSFISWKKEGSTDFHKPRNRTPQKILKKVLFEVAWMHCGGVLVESCEDDEIKDERWRPEADETGTNRVLSERKRRERINEKFFILKSLVPSIGKVDKVSILDDTIEYLKELKRTVDDLECFRKLTKLEESTSTKPLGSVERTSDNRGNNKTGSTKKPLMNKRKACFNYDEMSVVDDVIVSVIEKDVLVEIKCPWRECLLLEIMDSLSNLHLDTHSVQSSTVDGILSLTIKSKLKGSAVVTVGMLRQVLQSVVRKF